MKDVFGKSGDGDLYTVTSTYETDDPIGIDDSMEQKINDVAGPSDAAGSGFNGRDHSWYDLSKREAEEKVSALKRIGVQVEMELQRNPGDHGDA